MNIGKKNRKFLLPNRGKENRIFVCLCESINPDNKNHYEQSIRFKLEMPDKNELLQKYFKRMFVCSLKL